MNVHLIFVIKYSIWFRSSTNNYPHYKSSPIGNHDIEEQEQLSPLGSYYKLNKK